MARARQITTLVLGLSLSAPVGAVAQNATASWQATPASVLKNALRNVVAAQENFRKTHPVFAGTVEALRVDPGPDVKVQIFGVSASGWRAKAIHRARPGRSCVVFMGAVATADLPKTDGDGEMAGEEGVPLCDRME